MPLPGKGIVQPDGVIVGTYPELMPLYTLDPELLVQEVAKVLEVHHGMRVEVNSHNTRRLSKMAKDQIRESTGAGTIIRVFTSSGCVMVDGRRHDIDYGWWVFIPPGRKYRFQSTVVEGMNVEYVWANLTSRR